jgi:hypothetical protein
MHRMRRHGRRAYGDGVRKVLVVSLLFALALPGIAVAG